MPQDREVGPPLESLADAASALAGSLDLETVLDTIVGVAIRVTGARYAALGVIGTGEAITRFVTAGAPAGTAEAIGHYPTGKGLLGLLIRHPQVLRLDHLAAHPASAGFPAHHPPMATFLGAPVRSRGRVYGNLYLTEKDGGFVEDDERLIAVLAAQAGAAVENALLSMRLRELAVHEERERISRELHDGAIQALFSVGMGLQGARGLIGADPARAEQRLDGAVDAIDQTIRDLRSAIFHLQPADAAALGLSGGLAELAREYEVNALVRPVLDLVPGLDAHVSSGLVPDLLAVVRESLSNVAKHARAFTVAVRASVDDGGLALEVADDGMGFVPGGPTAGRGLGNVAERAASLGATLEIDSAPDEGTRVRLRVPLVEVGP